MRKLIMWNLMTLDGYFEGDAHWDLGFHELVWGNELEDISLRQLKSAAMLVFGKTTYKGMADYWTSEKGEIADFMNTIPKIVCSKTLEIADWHNTTIAANAINEITRVKAEGNGNMFVFGSAILSESLMKADLFDEYRLCIAPVFLGKGRSLFNQGIPYQKVKLVKSQTLSTGGIVLTYVAP